MGRHCGNSPASFPVHGIRGNILCVEPLAFHQFIITFDFIWHLRLTACDCDQIGLKVNQPFVLTLGSKTADDLP